VNRATRVVARPLCWVLALWCSGAQGQGFAIKGAHGQHPKLGSLHASMMRPAHASYTVVRDAD